MPELIRLSPKKYFLRTFFSRAGRVLVARTNGGSSFPNEMGERWLLSRLAGQIGNAIDVGYNAGSWTQELLKCNPGARVLAIDAVEDFRGEKVQNNVTFVGAAVGSVDGDIIRVYRKGGGANADPSPPTSSSGKSYTPLTLPTRSLDSLARENGFPDVDFIKIDVDGYDMKALWGAQELIENSRPFVQIETGKFWAFTNSHPVELFTFCERFGYKIYVLHTRGLRGVDYPEQLLNPFGSFDAVLIPG